MSTATIPRPRKTRRKKCIPAIQDLMTDYKPRTSEQIADIIGFNHGLVRKYLADVFNYERERRRVPGGGVVTYYSLKRHKKVKPRETQQEDNPQAIHRQ